MTPYPRPALATVVLDCADAPLLADFYRHLLGWEIRSAEPDWVLLQPPGGTGVRLALQGEPDYEPPVWPERPGAQQKMLHLDLHVDDLAAATARALCLGARDPGRQPQDDVRVLLDPAGHPFCLFLRD
ncbi:VOC family protein [Streptomyces sp. NPDC006798]|uniref:VOC family protein n=1 Tax=Streptomyces sp. NPDC006798 TaxID=3155462 RepID=UPI0033CA31E7